jgi:hypothetical protein
MFRDRKSKLVSEEGLAQIAKVKELTKIAESACRAQPTLIN